MKDTVVGVDLAAEQNNPSGICVLKKGSANTFILYSNHEIIEFIHEVKPTLVSIDSPLSFPLKRRGKEKILLRSCEKQLLAKKIKVLSFNLPSMVKLTNRGIKLSKEIRKKGVEVIEVFPRGAQKIFGFESKKKVDLLKKEFERLGLKFLREKISIHEIDALTAALVAYLHLLRRTVSYGDKEEGFIVMPKKREYFEILVF